MQTRWVIVLLSAAGLAILPTVSTTAQTVSLEDSLPPLPAGASPPGTVKELWADYDPQKEPLDTEVVKEWEQDGVVCRVVRYRVGVFKGAKAMVAAIYGFPKGKNHLPGLVQVHGGGQSANLNVVLTNARQGYASISVNWGGNPLGGIPDYRGPNTDWGRVDATQNGHNDHYGSLKPDAKTIDSVDSPRNNNWFLLNIAARRALTFLEQQPEVDGTRLGIYGHSMGGNISFETAAVDRRVKAAAPSAGAGIEDMSDNIKGTMFNRAAYAALLTCPVLLLNPANDFHGTITGTEETVRRMPTREFRYARPPHLNHRSPPEYTVCALLWFDQYLKGTFTVPKTPETTLDLKGKAGIPVLTVIPDTALSIEAVDVYYTQDTDAVPANRFWHHAATQRRGGAWVADLPVITRDKLLWAFANVRYPLAQPVTGAGFYYSTYTAQHFWLSSKLNIAAPETLHTAGIKVTERTSRLIESFGPGWQKEWYTFSDTDEWPWRTLKLNDPKWVMGSPGAKLALDIKTEQPNKLVVQIGDDVAEVEVKGGTQWQTITLDAVNFRNAKTGNSPTTWPLLPAEFMIGPSASVMKGGQSVSLGGTWKGALPEFRNLRWTDVK